MLVGIDALPLVPPWTGIGHYTFELACALAAISPSDQFQFLSPLPHTADLVRDHELPANLHAVDIESRLKRRRWWAFGLPLHAMTSGLSLFHGTNYEVPLWGRCATINSIHDLSLLLYPETHEPKRVRRARLRLPLMTRAATMVITATESAKRDVCEHLGVRPEKIGVTPFAPRRVFRPVAAEQAVMTLRRLGVEDNFLLFVGTVEPRKNLMTLVRALDEILRTTDLRPQLVIAGKEGWLTGELLSYIRSAGIDDRVRFTGYASDDDLCALYSTCQVMIYPSLYEGFGLPPLEAMACGAPVIASRDKSVMETLGAAARLVEATDVGRLAENIVELLRDEDAQSSLAAAGRKRAAQFTWERTARATLEVYYEALARKHGKGGA